MSKPPRLLFSRVEARSSDAPMHRVLIVTMLDDNGLPLLTEPIKYVGLGVALLQAPHPQNPRQIVEVPHQFEFPIPEATLGLAFTHWMKHQDVGWAAEHNNMRLAALRQGADLKNLPQGAIKG